MKRVYIIHGWEGFPEEGWFPWLRKELKDRGFEVYVPSMPEPSEPKIETWVEFVKNLVGKPNEDTYLIGHSIGGQTVIRYLDSLRGNEKIGGVLIVASWLARLTGDLTEEETEIVRPWVESPIDFENVRSRTKNIVAVFSDDDPFISLDNVNLFRKKLGAKTILEHGKGHSFPKAALHIILV